MLTSPPQDSGGLFIGVIKEVHNNIRPILLTVMLYSHKDITYALDSLNMIGRDTCVLSWSHRLVDGLLTLVEPSASVMPPILLRSASIGGLVAFDID
jgi:hypothetical protein